MTRWPTFWESFESAVHKELTDVDNFNYLRSLLELTAFDVISELALCAANYKEAVEILQKMFCNKSLIISKYMETLLGAAYVTSNQNLKDLRRLHDTIKSHL